MRKHHTTTNQYDGGVFFTLVAHQKGEKNKTHDRNLDSGAKANTSTQPQATQGKQFTHARNKRKHRDTHRKNHRHPQHAKEKPQTPTKRKGEHTRKHRNQKNNKENTNTKENTKHKHTEPTRKPLNLKSACVRTVKN